jgi:hypothetical protein
MVMLAMISTTPAMNASVATPMAMRRPHPLDDGPRLLIPVAPVDTGTASPPDLVGTRTRPVTWCV